MIFGLWVFKDSLASYCKRLKEDTPLVFYLQAEQTFIQNPTKLLTKLNLCLRVPYDSFFQKWACGYCKNTEEIEDVIREPNP